MSFATMTYKHYREFDKLDPQLSYFGPSHSVVISRLFYLYRCA